MQDNSLDGSNVPAHDLFYSRDEASEDGASIYSRERLMAVSPGISTSDAGSLAKAYYEDLKCKGAANGTKLCISVQVFDHKFEDKALRPAVASLSWREWGPKKAKIVFPLSGERSLSIIPPKPFKQSQPIQVEACVRSKAAPDHFAQNEDHRIDTVTGPKSKPQKKQTTRKSVNDDEKMIIAFERMQDIFDVREHDLSARFSLELAQELIECEAGSAMLLTPGKVSLYAAGATGPVGNDLVGREFSITEGIIGYAARSSVVINVADPATDSRFDSKWDKSTGFETRNILCAPIQHGHRTLGVIQLINSPDGFNLADENTLAYIGEALGAYIATSLPSRDDEAKANVRASAMPPKKNPELSKTRNLNPGIVNSTSG